jgi:hypothetical protein
MPALYATREFMKRLVFALELKPVNARETVFSESGNPFRPDSENKTLIRQGGCVRAG